MSNIHALKLVYLLILVDYYLLMILTLENEKIPCRIEKSRSRKLDLRFRSHEPVLLIRTPDGKLGQQAKSFLEQNESWILKQYRKRKGLTGQREIFLANIEKGIVPYLGKPHKLSFQLGRERWIKKEGEELIISIKSGEENNGKKNVVYSAMRSFSASYLKKRTYELAVQTESSFNTVRVKNQKSKWGSCSGLKNINLNWQLIFMDESLIDYIIIHELMHLREMNHSPRFWKWVETYYPTYKQAEKRIKEHQWLIGIFDN